MNLTHNIFKSQFIETKYSSLPYVAFAVILTLFLYTFFITCWLGDDALITFRQVWNFVHGHGMTFNFEERVQVFTHPLWFFILSGLVAVTGELFVTTSVVSVIISLISVALLILMEKNLNQDSFIFLTPVLFLLFSWSFVDFSSSGLENCLSYLLIGLLLLNLTSNNLRKNYSAIFTILSLLLLTRIDFAILFLPLALYLIIVEKSFKYSIKSMLIGSILLIIWFLFATFYFGSPFPNTFYAKLNADYPKSEYFLRGFEYFIELLQDPISPIIIIMGMIISLISRNRMLISLLIGQIAYLFYILQIGGDFMAGRFFAVPIYLSIGQIIIGFSVITGLNQKMKNYLFFVVW